jgi:chemotaxis response regulator CheB
VSESVRVYLIDRAGRPVNVFADKLAGRQGIELVGGASEVDEALDEITDVRPDVILVGTDVGGAGVVAAVERILTLAGEAAVVALCTRDDKALVDAAVRAGAAGSLDRDAGDVDIITALHVYRDRQHGVEVDMKLAEPEAERPGLRVSGALPRFPSPTSGPKVDHMKQPPSPRGIERAALEPAVDEAATAASTAPGGERQPEPELDPEAAGTVPKRRRFGIFGRRHDKKSSLSPTEGDDEEMNSS